MNSPKPGSTVSWDWQLPLERITTEVARIFRVRLEAARYFGQPDLRRPLSLSAAWGTPFRAAALKSNLA